MTNRNILRDSLVAGLLGAALLLPSVAFAGKGATYTSLKNAIATNNRDSIVSEIERAEKLPCGPCIDLVMPLVADVPNPAVSATWAILSSVMFGLVALVLVRARGVEAV